MTSRCAGLLATLLAGCFAPKYPEGLACGDGAATCPPGQSCDATGHCRVRPVDVDAPDPNPDDSDGDGVSNALDNCPAMSNPLQGDEDLDALGDACDPCPVHAENRDEDGDGVGDFCDPAPDAGNERITLFEGFDVVPAGWQIMGGWTFDRGAAVLEPGSGEPAFLVPPVTGSDGVLTAGLVTRPDESPTTAHSTGPAFFHLPSHQGVTCALAFDAMAGTRHFTAIDLSQPSVLQQHQFDWSDDMPYAIQVRRTAGEVSCDVASSLGVTDSLAVAYTSEAALVPVYRTRNIGVRVRWLMYVESVR